MRKKLVIAAAIVLLLLLSFIGVLRYRQYSAYKVPVHAMAKTIIKLNVDDLALLLVRNYGINFKNKITQKNKKDKDASLNMGLWLPGNIFVYNLSSLKPTTFFCTLPLHDEQDFILYAQRNWKLRFSKKEGIHYGSNEGGTLSVACNKDYVSLAWSPAKENVQTHLKEILRSKLLPELHPEITRLLQDEERPIAAIHGNNIASLDFKGKQLLLHATMGNFENLGLPATFAQTNNAANTHSYVSLNGMLHPSYFKKLYNIRQYQLSSDSVLAYFQGYLYLQIGPTTLQKDSISNYEYDDNFEKITRTTVTDVQVPSLQLSVKAAPGLLQYLLKQQMVLPSMELNPEIFPLFKVRLQEQNGLLQFTSGSKNTLLTLTGSDNFLTLKMDVATTASQLKIPFVDGYIQNMEVLSLLGSRKEGKLIVEGKLLFKGNAIKEVIDLVKRL